MKILFICGGLEPTKDGVGDYTRRLAYELIRKGHIVQLVSIHDQYIQEVDFTAQYDLEVKISCSRFPAIMPWSEKTYQVQKIIDNFNPDWISIQYVPYSFHAKGFAWNFNKFLNLLNFNSRLHIMMHELWIGIGSLASLKHRILGSVQRYLILKLIRSAKVDLITTSNILYMKILEENNISVEKLPLFSNIAFKNIIFEEKKLKFDLDDNYKIIAIFGTLYPDAKINEILTDFLSKNKNEKFTLISFGRMGNQDYWQQLQNTWQDQILFKQLGPLDQEDISAIMQLSHAAISCTPLEFLGKSGVYAAWKRHGVPVLIHYNQSSQLGNEIFYKMYISMEQMPASDWDVSHICDKFLNYLYEVDNSSTKS